MQPLLADIAPIAIKRALSAGCCIFFHLICTKTLSTVPVLLVQRSNLGYN